MTYIPSVLQNREIEKLPSDFIVVTKNDYMPLGIERFRRTGVDSWEELQLRDGQWYFGRWVNNSYALSKFGEGTAYAKIERGAVK